MHDKKFIDPDMKVILEETEIIKLECEKDPYLPDKYLMCKFQKKGTAKLSHEHQVNAVALWHPRSVVTDRVGIDVAFKSATCRLQSRKDRPEFRNMYCEDED